MMIPIILFAIAALGGAIMAIMRLKGRELPPMGLALVHGGFAASGLVFLLIEVINGTAVELARYALVIFVLAALGGFTLFSFHMRNKPLPVGMVLGHGLAAVVGFVLLLKSFVG